MHTRRAPAGAGTSGLRRAFAALALAAVAMSGSAVAFAQAFSDTLQTAFTVRTVGDAPLSHLQVSAPVNITSISVLNNITAAQNQKFLIYNSTSATFLLVSAPQAYAADGTGSFTWKQSAAFAPVTLQPGNDYLVGAISDTAGNWAYNTAGSFTQGAITSLQTNGNVSNYATPAANCCAGARIPLQLNGGAVAVVTPVPTLGPPTLAVLAAALALLGMAIARRRGRAR